MSNISVNTITDASGGSTASINGLTPQASNMQPFNRIINGAMTIDQRNAGAAVTGVGTFPVDRFQFVPHTGGGGAASAQQVLDGPDEFPYSTKLTVTTAGSGDLYLVQNIEANNLLSVGYGTPTAKQTTLSFWVKSSIAGIQSVFLYRPEVTRAVTLSYTINQSATWEYKTIVIPSDTTGANTRTNTTAVTLHWFVSSSLTATENTAWKALDAQRAVTGQVALASTLNATWQITGVQLEAGSTASSFAHENYGDTLQKCYRYCFYTPHNRTLPGYHYANPMVVMQFPVPMRAVPAIVVLNEGNAFTATDSQGQCTWTGTASAHSTTINETRIYWTSGSWSAYPPKGSGMFGSQSLIADAEL